MFHQETSVETIKLSTLCIVYNIFYGSSKISSNVFIFQECKENFHVLYRHMRYKMVKHIEVFLTILQRVKLPQSNDYIN